MPLRTVAIVFGIVLLIVGILGFVPSIAPDEMLFGIFHVNTAHNGVHLLSGAIALLCGLASTQASRLYFRIFGVIYGIVAVLGFLQGEGHLLGVISNNMADTWLHVVIAGASLALGFAVPHRHRVVQRA
jgi:hypothetical protein